MTCTKSNHAQWANGLGRAKRNKYTKISMNTPGWTNTLKRISYTRTNTPGQIQRETTTINRKRGDKKYAYGGSDGGMCVGYDQAGGQNATGGMIHTPPGMALLC